MARVRYEDSEHKYKVRALNMQEYYERTGRKSIPLGRQFWTLCGLQLPKGHGKYCSEIVQLTEAGFCTKDQYHGVDNNREYIERNKIWHPESHWHHGDWPDDLYYMDCFSPAVIYLDTTSFVASEHTSTMIARTMSRCCGNDEVMLFANVMMNNPRSGRRATDADIDELLEKIVMKLGPFRREWSDCVPNYTYNATGKTLMETLTFTKR